MLLELLAVYGGLVLARDAAVKVVIGTTRLGKYLGRRKRMQRKKRCT